MSGMGDGGPWSKFVTYAPTIHALCGLTHTTSVKNRQRHRHRLCTTTMAGLHGAVAILAGLESRRHSGKGQRIDISQFEVGVNFVAPSLIDHFSNRTSPSHRPMTFPTMRLLHTGSILLVKWRRIKGENWIAIACMTNEQWHSPVSGKLGGQKEILFPQ